MTFLVPKGLPHNIECSSTIKVLIVLKKSNTLKVQSLNGERLKKLKSGSILLTYNDIKQAFFF